MAKIPEGFEAVSTPAPTATPTPSSIPEGFEAVATPEKTAMQQIDEALLSIPGMRQFSEIAAATNKSVLDIIDFFGPDAINAVLQVSGSEARVPTAAALGESLNVSRGGFVEPGLQQDILRGAGQTIPAAVGVGSLLRAGAQQLPAMTAKTEGTISGILRQMGGGTAGADVTLGAASGAGAVLGEEVAGTPGEIAGAFLAPLSISASSTPIKNALSKGAEGVSNLITGITKSTTGMTDEGASKLLGEALVREGMSPNDVVAKLQQLGPDAIPADAANSFARLLNAASRKIPRIEGRAAQVFGERQKGQAVRIIDSLDDASGTSSLSLDDEIARLNNAFGPEIDDLYAAARQAEFTPSQKLNKLVSESPSLIKASQAANAALKDRQALGKPTSQIDLIDATKRQLDDQIGKSIRDGENNKAMDLVELKNALIKEADESVPEYKQARDMFAGKAQLENAGSLGEMFFKIKPADMKKVTSGMSESEKKMFRLGAKQAIIDKMDNLQTNADAVKRLFGRRGDVDKLRTLFDDADSFNRFKSALEREGQFILTRNAAQKTSGTPQQLFDAQRGDDALAEAGEFLRNPSPRIFSRLLRGLKQKKGTKDFSDSWQAAGDILLESGMNPDKLRAILSQGRSQVIEKELRKVINLADPTRAAIAEQVIE